MKLHSRADFDGFRRASTSTNYSPITMLPSPAPGGVLAESLLFMSHR